MENLKNVNFNLIRGSDPVTERISNEIMDITDKEFNKLDNIIGSTHQSRFISSILESMMNSFGNVIFKIKMGVKHGDKFEQEYLQSLPEGLKTIIRAYEDVYYKDK